MIHHCGCHQPPVTWSGALTCHCAACGLTFSGVATFDEHQPAGGKCLTLAQLARRGIQPVRDSVLGRPTSTGGTSAPRPRGNRGRFE